MKLASGQSFSTLSKIATTGVYTDLFSLPTLATMASQSACAVALTGGTVLASSIASTPYALTYASTTAISWPNGLVILYDGSNYYGQAALSS